MLAMSVSSSYPSALAPVLYAGIAVLAIVLPIGCGHAVYDARHTDISQVHLPTERSIPYHPDSLVHVRIVEEDNGYDMALDEDFSSLWRAWSAQRHFRGGQLPEYSGSVYQSFATLWSLDLSLAFLDRGQGIGGLTKDLAKQQIDAQIEHHSNHIRIDVYRYGDARSPSSTWTDRPGRTIVLRDAEGNEYEPVETQSTIPERIPGVRSSSEVVYRRTKLVFERVYEGRDLLNDTQQLRLVIQGETARRSDMQFYSWSFGNGQVAVAD